MKSRRLLHSLGLVLVAGLLLAGCTNSSPTKHGKTASSSAQSSSSTVNSSPTSTTNRKQSSTPWNDSKDQQLEKFINSWAPTMGQQYEKYSGQGNIRTKAGMEYPSQLDKTTVNGTNDSIGWAPSGKGPYAYNVVALYNYNRPGNAATHITYAFAFHDGQPVALVDQSTNGTPDWTPTKNADVSSNFARIANSN